jgi:type VI secretion system secreted protein Hcp
MAFGSKTVTPRNLSHSLFSMAFQSDGHSGSGGKRDTSKTPIVIVKQRDSSSPGLYQACCTNEVLQTADLSFVRPTGSGGKEVVVSRITLTNAVISNVGRFTPLVPPKKGRPRWQTITDELEKVKLTFQKIEYTNVAGKISATDDWTA